MTFRTRAFFLPFVVLASFPGYAADDPASLALRPTSEWRLDYADDSCRLGRLFGEGDESTAFYIERFEPGDEFFILVAGKPLGRVSERSVVGFGPAGFQSTRPMQIGSLKDLKPGLMSSGFRLVPYKNKILAGSGASSRDWRKYEEAKIREPAVSPDEEEAISWVEVQPVEGRVVRLMLGNMGAPMAALRTCTDELVTHWGLDVEAHRHLSRPVVPASYPGTWMTADEYPRDLLSAGAQGMVYFRLSVSADGEPTQCHIQQSTRPQGFDEAVCRSIMRKAKFQPALDQSGKPIASYWNSSVRFSLPE